MKKQAELFLAFLKVPIDYLTLVCAGLLAYVLRYQTSIKEIRPIVFDLPFREYFIFVLICAFAWIFVFAAACL